MLKTFTDWLVFDLFSLSEVTAIGKSVHYFVYDSIEILFLLLIMTYLMSLLRYYLPVEKLRDFLTRRKYYGLDYLLASLFGAVTPFCSCSSIPLFVGFTGAGIPLGVTFSFLITSPLINEVAVALFVGLFGWKITLIYVSSGILIGTVGGYVLGKLRMERYVESFLMNSNANVPAESKRKSVSGVLREVSREAWGIFNKVALFVLLGVSVGALIHGFVPDGYFEEYMRADNFWTVPLAVLLAVPIYANAQGVIPIVQSLVVKGVPLGTALAFMMATVGLSLPEALILKRVMKLPLLFSFFGLVALGMIIIGYGLNMIV